MKTLQKWAGVSALGVLLITGNLYAQTKPVDSTRLFLEKLVNSKTTEDKALLNNKLKALAVSNSEKDVDLAINYYFRIKNQKAVDSLLEVEVQKFPTGSRARGKAAQNIYDEKTGADKEKAYQAWIKKFPAKGSGEENIVYDYVVSAIAQAYASEKNTAKAIEYIEKLQVDFWKGNGFGGIAETFRKNGDLKNATVYYKKAMESAKTYYDGKLPSENSSKFAASGYPGLTMTYAGLLFEQKNYNEALKYAELAAKNPATASPRSNFQYAKILMALNRNQEAYTKLEEAVKSGKANDEMSAAFKQVYIKVKGSEAGFDQYTAEIRKGILANLQQKLNKEITKTPAANFTLTDINGKKVSLSDYKGKVVILDFWATWCGPCKASFPAMQMAVNKYKDDANVQFLFIHTWEKTASPTQDASDYIKSQKYTFEVLMDNKDPETKINKVVSDYKVKGIPAKFVIDPQGNVRFSLMGFEGSNEAAVDEISMMIDMARKG
ncbi:TlpA disulfide reductase family protein [Pedobacter rhizosphaerae]|uniref:Thiol-disulfide isomerase or thioredoxin n=1 Tax=Pedobacter rhizosphaerae TaxID=390241 RepID=A0A1H9JPG6_9SPHI|nr:TlpA disulfide reductase family protein [Pedobacter rhizosphaerae]SEQ88505.1 Thiol-disulfide isomerase or thioredoxin [Pedobacter rhizosphaerae]